MHRGQSTLDRPYPTRTLLTSAPARRRAGYDTFTVKFIETEGKCGVGYATGATEEDTRRSEAEFVSAFDDLLRNQRDQVPPHHFYERLLSILVRPREAMRFDDNLGETADGDDGDVGKERKKTNMNRRMKKMTNPLAAQFREAKTLDDAYWRTVFADATRPLLVDVGTAKGGFVKALAGERADACSRAKSGIEYNLLGVEIYEPLVEAANAWTAANKMSLKRDAHFVSCNVNVSLSALNLPNVRAVCVQFPDPWSRGKHVERRVMTPDFARALADILPRRGELYCCSDVRALAEEMYDVVAANDDFELDEDTYARVGETRHEDFDDASRASASEHAPEYDAAHQYEWQSLAEIKEGAIERVAHRRWLRANPYECSTERDVVCEGKHRPVFRFAAVRA